MATSSKVQFKLETLREEALKSIDARIEMAAAHAAQFRNEEDLLQAVADWRARQEARLSEIFSKLGGDELSNTELASFRVEKMPEVDYYDSQRADRDLRELQAIRTQIVAKGNALVPDEDGNIALTKTQMSEFFGL